jgi:hypothetical protein
MIERAVLESPMAFDYFLGGHELATPYYDTDEEFYECPNSGKEIHCSLDTYLSTFGGLKEVFESPYFTGYHDKKSTNPVDDFIAGIMNQDNLYEALITIESELYSNRWDNSQGNVLMANQLNTIKSDYGIEAGIVQEGDDLVVVVTDPDALVIKDIIQLKPKTPTMKLK